MAAFVWMQYLMGRITARQVWDMAKKGIICHQVNYQGVMGGGIAYSIAEKLLSAEQYREYQRLCAENVGMLSWQICFARMLSPGMDNL